MVNNYSSSVWNPRIEKTGTHLQQTLPWAANGGSVFYCKLLSVTKLTATQSTLLIVTANLIWFNQETAAIISQSNISDYLPNLSLFIMNSIVYWKTWLSHGLKRYEIPWTMSLSTRLPINYESFWSRCSSRTDNAEALKQRSLCKPVRIANKITAKHYVN